MDPTTVGVFACIFIGGLCLALVAERVTAK